MGLHTASCSATPVHVGLSICVRPMEGRAAYEISTRPSCARSEKVPPGAIPHPIRANDYMDVTKVPSSVNQGDLLNNLEASDVWTIIRIANRAPERCVAKAPLLSARHRPVDGLLPRLHRLVPGRPAHPSQREGHRIGRGMKRPRRGISRVTPAGRTSRTWQQPRRLAGWLRNRRTSCEIGRSRSATQYGGHATLGYLVPRLPTLAR